jgi:hypothetical protein
LNGTACETLDQCCDLGEHAAMPHISASLSLTPRNPGWTWDSNRDGNFQLSLKKEGWQIRVIGAVSTRFEQAVFEADPARYAIETGRSDQLKAIGRLQKSGAFPRTLLTELAKREAPMSTDKGLIRFYAGLVCDPRTSEHVFLYITLSYRPDLEGKQAAYLGEVVRLMKQVDAVAAETRQAPVPAPTPAPAAPPTLDLRATRLDRMDAYDSGAYAGGGSYSIQESIILLADHTCRYRYDKVISIPGMSGGFQQVQSDGTWSFDGHALRLTLDNAADQIRRVQRAPGGKLLLDGEPFWLRAL